MKRSDKFFATLFIYFYVLPSVILLKTGVLHWLSSVYWAIKTQMPYGSKWLWEKPIAALIVINRITKLVYKISLSKILSPHWLHKNIQPSKGEGTKRPNKGNEDKARGGGGKNFRRPFTLK